ncbi:MAG TPA: YciI family protein [Myxococcales bacterium]|jgi:hypothetical protein|nr:YciI family protein [Myxococcales bacterium]
MEYVLLIYRNEAELAARSDAERQALFAEYMALTRSLEQEGKLRGGQFLHGPALTTTVRVRQGSVLATDGPFAETKEQLTGFYVVAAADLDEAMALAARIPSARDGSIEVRPVRASHVPGAEPATY